MKKVLITGATGMVGRCVLNSLLNNNEVGNILSTGRSKTGISHDKLNEIIHDDFMNYDALKEELKDIDACFYCLSVYQSQVNKEEYQRITCDYLQAFVNVLQETNPNAIFVLHGAAGADPTEKSRILFARAKGKAENIVNNALFSKKYIFRPGHIQPSGNRKPPGKFYRFSLPLIGLLFKIIPAIGVTDKNLGSVMAAVGLNRNLSSQVFENKDIRKLIA
jgi:uncharacterized protein YbjT (DUF2867 family)